MRCHLYRNTKELLLVILVVTAKKRAKGDKHQNNINTDPFDPATATNPLTVQPQSLPQPNQMQNCPNNIVIHPRILVLTYDARTKQLEIMCPQQDGVRFTASDDTKILLQMQVKTHSPNNPSGTTGDFTTFAQVDGNWSSAAVVTDQRILTQLEGEVSGTYYTGGLLYHNARAGCNHNEFEFRCVYVLSQSKGRGSVLRCQTQSQVQATAISNGKIVTGLTPHQSSYNEKDQVQMSCTVTSVPALLGRPLKNWIWAKKSQYDPSNSTWFPVHITYIKGPLNSCNFVVSTSTLTIQVSRDMCACPMRCYLANLDLKETGFVDKIYKLAEFPPLLCGTSFLKASTSAGYNPVIPMPRSLVLLIVLAGAMPRVG